MGSVQRSGNVQIPITTERVGDRTVHRVTWYAAGKRMRRGFADPQEAQQFAREKAQELREHGDVDLTLTGAEKLAYRRAIAAAGQCGSPLDSIAEEYAAARKILGGLSLLDACRAFAGTRDASPCPAMAQLVEEFVAHKRALGLSRDHVEDLRKSLARFANVVRIELPMVRPRNVEDWLAGMGKASQRSKRNRLAALRNLVGYCERRGYLPKGSLDLSVIELRHTESDVQIYTPAQLRTILGAVRPSEIPFVVIGAFTGMRSAEITRLRWEDIRGDMIDVRARNSKTRQRRLVPVLPVLRAWLDLHRKNDGPVCPLHDPIAPIAWRTREAGVEWLHNGLRHSFGSYRMATIKNEAQVALEMGNSPAMVFRHYRAVVTDERAVEWFGVGPDHIPIRSPGLNTTAEQFAGGR